MELFDRIVDYPNEVARRRYDRLIGVEVLKDRFLKHAMVLTNPIAIEEWSKSQYGKVVRLVEWAAEFPSSLIILWGDVGTGKSVFSEGATDALARATGEKTRMFSMSLRVRGQGLVGEMSSKIEEAFSVVAERASSVWKGVGQRGGLTVLLIDEADALGESRETPQMHHEDRVGVDAVIRGIDGVRHRGDRVLILLCTNRLHALDAALQRRAALRLEFSRPDASQRRALFDAMFSDIGVSTDHIDRLVEISGGILDHGIGWTFSDIADRFSREVLVDAIGSGRASPDRLLEMAAAFTTTPAQTAFR